MAKEKFKISTFSRQMTPEEAEQEKRKKSSLGESLREADRLYKERKEK